MAKVNKAGRASRVVKARVKVKAKDNKGAKASKVTRAAAAEASKAALRRMATAPTADA